MAKCWIFQANPDTFNIIGELKRSSAYPLSHWTIRQHRQDVKCGDTAFIWKAAADEGNAGIYAVAKVISDVLRLPVIWGKEFWRNTEDIREEPRAIIQYTKELVRTPLLKADLVAIPELKDLKILSNWRQTVYSVTDSQCQALNRLIP